MKVNLNDFLHDPNFANYLLYHCIDGITLTQQLINVGNGRSSFVQLVDHAG